MVGYGYLAAFIKLKKLCILIGTYSAWLSYIITGYVKPTDKCPGHLLDLK